MSEIDEIGKYLIGFALGIRFRANFAISDQLGEIIDTILYSKNSLFSPTMFPNVSQSVGGRILFNAETDNRLIIDNSNIILDITTAEKDRVRDYISAFERDLINGIMKEYKIKEIIRIGFVKRYLYQIPALASFFVGKTIGGTIDGINDINLGFSKKIVTETALIKKDINDYDNIIFNVIKKADLEELYMSVDYQRLFSPFLEDVNGIKYLEFISQAESFNQRSYPKWINSYMEEINGKQE